MSKINSVFSASRKAGRLVLMPFIPAGYPSIDATAAAIVAISAELEKHGGGLIEIGIPFSDPIADGPVIQEAFTHALSHGIRLTHVLDMVRSIRSQVSVPLVAMVSYSIAFRKGISKFASDLKSAGFDGLIIPDLPPPEAQYVTDILAAAALDTILLVSPTTPPDRREVIAKLSTGFIYYLSVSGITGERTALPPELVSGLDHMKSLTTKPVCVGFGISTPAHLALLKGHADGAIIGSALVKRLRTHGDKPQDVANSAAAFCRELLAT